MKTLLLILAIAIWLPSPAQAQSLLTKSEFEKRVTAEAVRNRKLRTAGGDYDDKRDVISFKLKFTNYDLNVGFQDMSCEFYIFGQQIVASKAFKLLGAENLPLSIPELGTTELESKEVVSQWDNTGVRFGAKYDSWVLVVRDATGTIVMKKSSSPNWLPV